MNRRQVIQALAGAFPAVLRGARRAGDKPNLLLILTDQQRYSTMAAYGNTGYRVPVMNRLTSESIVLERCYVSQPVCTPSRASLMTGLWPHTNGCVRNNVPLRADIPALPEIDPDASYRTAYFGKWHLGDEFQPHHGFEQRVSIEDGYNTDSSEGGGRAQRSDYHEFLLRNGYKPDTEHGTFSREFAARLPVAHTKASFLAELSADFILKRRHEPWILCVGFLEPHRPYDGPLNELHSHADAPLPGNYPGWIEREPECYRFVRDDVRKKGYDVSDPALIQRLNRNYAGVCSLVDQAVGRILWALDASGQAGNTIVVLTSDHGEMMGSHSLLTKMVMYEEALRVPLLIRAPFRQDHMVVTQPVSNVCVLPTVLELMGRKIPETLEGESLLGLVQGKALRENHVFVEWNDAPDSVRATARAVVSPDGWKLALYDRDNCMLFDHRHDPLELKNMYYQPGSRDVIRKLRGAIEAWQERTGDTAEINGRT